MATQGGRVVSLCARMKDFVVRHQGIDETSVQTEEDQRWHALEAGEAQFRWRTCLACGFLNAVSLSHCEACQASQGHGIRQDAQYPQPKCQQEVQPRQHEDTSGDRDTLQLLCVPLYLDSRPLDLGEYRSWQRKVMRSSRSQLLQALFQGLDDCGSGVLGRWGMYRYARRCGFTSGEKAWAYEYETMCAKYSLEVSMGLDVETFGALLSDPRFGGYSEDSEIREMLLADSGRLLRSVARRGGDWAAVSEAGSDVGKEEELDPLILQLRGKEEELEAAATAEEPEAEKGEAPQKAEEDAEEGEGEDADEEEDAPEEEEEHATAEEQFGWDPSSCLDCSPPVGTLVEVLFSDNRWYVARLEDVVDTRATAVYVDDESRGELNFEEDFVRHPELSAEEPVVDEEAEPEGEELCEETEVEPQFRFINGADCERSHPSIDELPEDPIDAFLCKREAFPDSPSSSTTMPPTRAPSSGGASDDDTSDGEDEQPSKRGHGLCLSSGLEECRRRLELQESVSPAES